MMPGKTKIWLIAAASLVILGLIVFAAAMQAYGWDFSRLNTTQYETNAYELSGDFRNIRMNTDTADILFVPSDDGVCRVVCYEPENAKHYVTHEENTLAIREIPEKKWYDHIGLWTGRPKITVYLPDAVYGALSIEESTGDIEIPKAFAFESIDILTSTGDVKNDASASELIKILTSTGDIRVENISTDTLDLSVSTGVVIARSVTCEGDIKVSVSTGDTQLTDVACKGVISTGSTGDISLMNVIAAEQFSIVRSTGDVTFDSCEAAELFINTDTGDVTGSLLTDKIFMVETDTGHIDVPKSVTGGKCEIRTNTGDIDIRVG